jgi:hypothetical protein
VSVNYWNNKTVTLNDAWGMGADHTLSTPLKVMPQFCMRPRFLKDDTGVVRQAHFSVDFFSGYLSDGWQGVNFIPMGTQPVAGISGLPPWDPAQKDVYRRAIAAASGSFDNSQTARLEAVVPYVSGQGAVGFNKVRLFYIDGAVKAPNPDLVVVKIATHVNPAGTVQARQNGDGHGPPH